MNGTVTIGVLGASGAVGRAAVRALRDLGRTGLRLGGRAEEPLRAVLAAELDGRGRVVPTDMEDPAALAAFVSDCDVVLNCAGPTYRFGATAARAALAAGAHCVDVAGDDPAAEELNARPLPEAARRAVVLSAGTLPGLSSLLPRLAARELDTTAALEAYCGGLEPCSPTVAADLVLSLTSGGPAGAAYGEALAAVRGGRRASRVLRAERDATVPGFPGRVALVPFLGEETVRLAGALGLERADCWNVHPGSRVHAVLTALPAALAAGEEPRLLEERLSRAAAVDLAGRSPYYAMEFRLTGTSGGVPAERRLRLRTTSSYRLTGAVGALAADAVARGAVPPGTHFACDVLDPEEVVSGLVALGAVDVLVRDAPDPGRPAAAGRDEEEEGEL
ncbi:saccharopine dehydrogenase NADP-binding domain-containing protein [Streptomyces sp. NPDC006684]|uniref:saccharopine dehydrogenase NADP-binding domain-containing protein n=1 Tax=Streptomyces sp. NPDC006684 TaxID=3154477 RepID=UPI003451EC19